MGDWFLFMWVHHPLYNFLIKKRCFVGLYTFAFCRFLSDKKFYRLKDDKNRHDTDIYLQLYSVKISHGKLLEVQERISKDKHVSGMYDITREWDSLIIGHFKDRKDLNGFIKGVLSIQNVEKKHPNSSEYREK